MSTADAVRNLNEELDQELLALVDRVDDRSLHVRPGGEEWTLAQILAHLAEFPPFFAAQLRAQLRGDGLEIGRLLENPRRLAAVGSAAARGLDDLKSSVRSGFETFAAAIEKLDDEHLTMPVQNVKYGQENLMTFLNRYVLDHKQEHVDQLSETLRIVTERLT